MTSPLFFDWLDAKMAVHVGKVVPPAPVMAERVRAGVRANLRAPIVERALADAGVDRQVDDAERALADRMAAPS